MDEIVTVIPNYDIVEKLGEGPQSIVYKAFHNAAKPQPKGRADAPLQRGFSGCLP